MNSAEGLTLNAWIEKGGFAEAVVRMAIAGGAAPLLPDAPLWNDDPRLAAVPADVHPAGKLWVAWRTARRAARNRI